MIKSVRGVGYCSDSTLTARVGGNITECYQKWVSMLTRAYCPKYQKRFPTYTGVEVCKDWLDFKNFKSWFDNYKYRSMGWELDKDLVGDGTLYSPETCCFLPKHLNYLLLEGQGKSVYKELPKGVTFHKRVNRYYVQCSLGNGSYKRVYCDTVEDALDAYNQIKVSVIQDCVSNYSSDLDPRVIETLSNRFYPNE